MSNSISIQQLPLSDVERMGDVLARSRMFGFKNTEEAVASCQGCARVPRNPRPTGTEG